MTNYNGVRMNKSLREDGNLSLLATYALWHGVSVQDLVRRYPNARSSNEIAMREMDKVGAQIEHMVLHGKIACKYNIDDDGKTIIETSAHNIAERVFRLANALSVASENLYNGSTNALAKEKKTAEKIENNLEEVFGIQKDSPAHDILVYWIDLNRFLHDSRKL